MKTDAITKIDDKRFDVALKTEDLFYFAQGLKEGQIIKSGKKHLTIIKKHPYFAVTNLGCLPWVDIWNFSMGYFNAPNTYAYVDSNGFQKPFGETMHG